MFFRKLWQTKDGKHYRESAYQSCQWIISILDRYRNENAALHASVGSSAPLLYCLITRYIAGNACTSQTFLTTWANPMARRNVRRVRSSIVSFARMSHSVAGMGTMDSLKRTLREDTMPRVRVSGYILHSPRQSSLILYVSPTCTPSLAKVPWKWGFIANQSMMLAWQKHRHWTSLRLTATRSHPYTTFWTYFSGSSINVYEDDGQEPIGWSPQTQTPRTWRNRQNRKQADETQRRFSSYRRVRV